MKYISLLLVSAALLSACANDISSVGVGATYTDPDTGASYGGNVNVGLRDKSKVIHRPVQSMNDNQPKFWPSLGRGLARMVDGPYPDRTHGKTLEETLFTEQP